MFEIATYKYQKTAEQHMEDLKKKPSNFQYRVTTNQRGRYVIEITTAKGEKCYATKRKSKAA